MENYFKKLTKLLKKHGRPQVAIWLKLKSTRTCDAWYLRKLIPSKYLDTIEKLYKEKK